MTMNTTNNHDESEADLALVAGKLLSAMPARMPQRLASPSLCGWCGDEGTNHNGETVGWRQKQADPAAWVLHVLREHLRGLLGDARASVSFNSSGGATVVLHDAYPEDVVLFRDALGVELSCVLQFESNGEQRCSVNFGTEPFGRSVTMIWMTSPAFMRLAAQLVRSGWPFNPSL
jgi:hypothetical protein